MAAAPSDPPFRGGTVLFCGGTDFSQLGRTRKRNMSEVEKQELLDRTERYPNLPEPHRIKALMGVKIRFVASGCASVHCIAGDMDGRLFTWGRNEKGQLGHGDTHQRNVPTLVEALRNKNVVTAAGGRHHTVVVIDDGTSQAFGSNLQGQCGTGVVKSKDKYEELLLSPAPALVSDCTAVSCGIEFTMWLCDGKLFAAGMPQYGQLGDGTDHEYNAKESSVKLVYAPQPTPILLQNILADRKIVAVACGHNHTLAVDSEGIACSWGFGGYGRLGHKVQQDEFRPRPLEGFLGRVRVDTDNLVLSAGGTSSFLTAAGGQLYAWGKLKSNGDSLMYPQPYMELSGWKIRNMSCGPGTFAVASEKSVITWGHAANGELGYGPLGKKSSANPEKCDALEGLYTHQVACGAGFTLFLTDLDYETAEKFSVWDCMEEEQEEKAPAKRGGAAGKKQTASSSKRKTSGVAAKGKAKKRK
eukprot:evm.model.scf_450.2 EVM.evm.TU.scf_450.2   scf_450:27460-36815(+)